MALSLTQDQGLITLGAACARSKRHCVAVLTHGIKERGRCAIYPPVRVASWSKGGSGPGNHPSDSNDEGLMEVVHSHVCSEATGIHPVMRSEKTVCR